MNMKLQCPLHKKPITQACTDFDCQNDPLICDDCDQHIRHQKSSLNTFTQQLARQIEENLTQGSKYREVFVQQSIYLKHFNNSNDHLQNFEAFIRQQKIQIEEDYNLALNRWTSTLNTERENLVNRLDTYFQIYRSNFCYVKEIIEPIQYLVNKCRYYGNENNLKLKLSSNQQLGIQIKMSLQQLQQTLTPEMLSSALKSLSKAFEIPSYRNEPFQALLANSIKSMQDHFKTSFVIPDISPIQQATKESDSASSNAIPPMPNLNIVDNRILEQEAPINKLKFKIKKKISLDFQVNAIAIVANQYVALGLKEGTLKLLDLATSKVSFYPNTHMSHAKEVCDLVVLQQTKGIRLASASNENYVIIWTLGDNKVPYPERKLIGFKEPIIRILDIQDGANLACQSIKSLTLVNYHDNRTLYAFPTKGDIVDFLYISKMERFVSITTTNQVQIYSFRFKTSVQGVNLLVNCQIDHSIQALQMGNICACIACDFNNDVVICYGCTDGSVKLFNVLRNALIADIQLFQSKIVEMVIVKYNKTFTLVVIAENDKVIKGITLDGKPIIYDKFGEMLDCCSKSDSKHGVQIFLRATDKTALLVLNENQKDISQYELC